MQERMQKFNTAFNPITVLIFHPTQAVVSVLCANQIPFSQGDEIPGLLKEITNKASICFSKVWLFGFFLSFWISFLIFCFVRGRRDRITGIMQPIPTDDLNEGIQICTFT